MKTYKLRMINGELTLLECEVVPVKTMKFKKGISKLINKIREILIATWIAFLLILLAGETEDLNFLIMKSVVGIILLVITIKILYKEK